MYKYEVVVKNLFQSIYFLILGDMVVMERIRL